MAVPVIREFEVAERAVAVAVLGVVAASVCDPPNAAIDWLRCSLIV